MKGLRSSLFALGCAVALSLAVGAVHGEERERPAGPKLKNHARLRAAMAVAKRHAARIMRMRGVVAMGTGVASDGEPVVKVFTSKAGVAGIPRSMDGFAVNVRVTGRIRALQIPPDPGPAGRWTRPVPIGVSTGHPAITAGTLGARVKKAGNVFALSNNHVYASINNASVGDNVLQPGTFDGGVNPDDAIGTLFDFEPIQFCTVFFFFANCPNVNQMDAAIAATGTSEVGAATPPDGYGTPNALLHEAYGNPAIVGDEHVSLLVGEPVQKYGRTTGLTSGAVDAVNATVDVCYDEFCSLLARFENQLLISSPGTFSDGGDSGSLIVSQNGNHPVGLLFAGSETATVANRIDLVLNRFGVTIDDGGAVTPVSDIALQSISVPSTAVVAEQTSVIVTLRNVGNQPVGSFDVVLMDETEAVLIGTRTVASGLSPGESVEETFTWMPTSSGLHTLGARREPGDDNAANDAVTTSVTVLEEAMAGPVLRLWQGWVSTDAWTTVSLDQDYGADMVVVCTPSYDRSDLGPAMARVRNASGSRFEVGLARPWFGAFPFEHWSAYVHCMVVRAGVYTQAEHGVNMEAVRLDDFASKDHTRSWSGQARSYANSYSSPVVVGQVISQSTTIPGSVTEWSVFWSRGARVNRAPSSSALFVGRHTGADPSPRPPETLAYVVIEAGVGTMEGVRYSAALGPDAVRGIGNNPPYGYALSGLSTASTAVLSQAGMDGGDGSWAVLYGANPVSASQLLTAVDEDWYWDSERRHTTEQIGYIVFE